MPHTQDLLGLRHDFQDHGVRSRKVCKHRPRWFFILSKEGLEADSPKMKLVYIAGEQLN